MDAIETVLRRNACLWTHVGDNPSAWYFSHWGVYLRENDLKTPTLG